MTITEPGVYDIPHDDYHADPVDGGSLSSTGARLLLPPSCPAKYRWIRDHGEEPRKAWDIGQAAHTLALGVGPELLVIPGDRWDTKAAKQAVSAARANGVVPLKEADMATATAMVAALRADPIAGPLFTPGAPGRAEASLFWIDDATKVWCRSRIDWLPDADPDTGRLVLIEYKTCASADPTALQKAAYDHGYHVQAWWQTEACRALRLSPAPLIIFVFQEKDPPYLPVVKQAHDTFLNLGRIKAREAMETYARCTAAQLWPSFPGSDEVDWLRLPPWVEATWGDAIR